MGIVGEKSIIGKVFVLLLIPFEDSGRGSSSAGAGHCSPGRHPGLLVTVRGRTGLAPCVEEGKSCWAHLLAKEFMADSFGLTVEMEWGHSLELGHSLRLGHSFELGHSKAVLISSQEPLFPAGAGLS